MNVFFYLTSLAFFLWAIRNILYWTTLWQLKEYRLDRLIAHFRETAKGKAVLRSKMLFVKWFTLFLYIYFAVHEDLLIFYNVLVFIIFAVEGVKVVKEIISHTIKRPVFTAKAIVFVNILLALVVFLYWIPLLSERFLWLLIIDRIIPIFSSVIVIFLSFPTEFLQDLSISKATKLIQKYENLLVIGISGSYGKSSTKEYVAQILSSKFSVLKTEGSHNTPIGISNSILKGLKTNTKIFVVELGSYKRGEVLELCNIVRPKIGITTSISDQHLSLFGSFENIFDTENELITSLPKDGFAMFNGNDSGAYKLYLKTRIKKVLYETNSRKKSALEKRKNLPEISAEHISMNKKSLIFSVIYKNKTYKYESPLLGEHNVENILPAIYLAHYLGMTYKEIKYAVSHLLPLEKRMIRRELINGGVVIDDTFNASPESIYAALSYMKLYKGKKVLVLEPMIELGKNGGKNHYDLGKKISEICDYLFLTNKNYYKDITRGITDGKGTCEVEVVNAQEVVDFITKNIAKDDIVIFEGREAAFAINRII